MGDDDGDPGTLLRATTGVVMEMRTLRGWLLRLFGLFHRQQREREFAEELESHLAFHIEDNLRAGLSPEEARRRALIKLGGVALTQELHREQRGLPMLETLIQDLRLGLRMLRKRPGFTAAIITSLTLGILPIIVVGSLINAVWLRPPRHVQAPERLAAIFITGDPASGSQYAGLLYPDVSAIRQRVGSFADVLAYSFDEFNFTDEAGTRALLGASVSENYFALLGVSLFSGRGFASTERAPDTVVLGYVAWQRRFGADPAMIGKTIKLDGKPRTVIGVAPPGLLAFGQPVEPEVYVPLPDDPVERRNSRRLAVLARLRPEATIEQARSQLQALQVGLRKEYPQYWPEPGKDKAVSAAPEFAVFPQAATRIPLDRRLEFSVAFSLLSFLALLALVAACSNLANLLLARGAERASEIAVRLALGAQRWRVVALLLSESLLLLSLASALGLMVAYWVSRAIAAGYLLPGMENIGVDFTIDLRVVALVAALSLATGVLFGLAPALQTARLDLLSALKGGPKLFGSTRRINLRNVFVAAQVAASLILLSTAGLFLRGLQQAAKTDLGFDPNGVVAVELELPREAYAEAEARRFLAEIEQRLRTRPEVQHVGLAWWSPFSGRSVATGIKLPDGRKDSGFINLAGTGYFELMKTPLLAGRYFRDTDTPARVAIVNEELARACWPNEAPTDVLGRHFIPTRTGEPVEIIGVVRNARYTYLAEPQFLHLWLPFSAAALFKLKTDEPALTSQRAVLLVRAAGEVKTLLPAIRPLSLQTDGRVLVRQPQLLAGLVAERGTDDFVLGSRVAGAVGLFALILACVGVYGVLSFTVSQRTKEIGLRLALGARRVDIIRTVLARGLRFTAFGLAVGLALALGVSALLASAFEGLSGLDVVSLGTSVVVLAIAALLAALLPALRASKVDPLTALRSD
jgi:predicted permease